MKSFDSMIIVLYGVIVVFFLYRIVKQMRDKKKLEGNVESFKRPSSTFEVILFSVLTVTGIVNLYFGYVQNNKQNMLTAVVMIALAVVFAISTRSKLYVAENGILSNAAFSTYKQIKKWGFDPENGDFVMLVKDKKGENREVTKVNKADIDKINTLIRKYKLGK